MKRMISIALCLLIVFSLSACISPKPSTDTSSSENTVSTVSDASAIPTVKEFLMAAFEPVGDCLYVYGGGWNEADTGAGEEALTKGVSPRWDEFFRENGADYDYEQTRYQIHDGLDCTGYVGYVAYQVFGDKYAKEGYVFTSTTMPTEYQKLFGGTLTPASEITDYQPGDIMGTKGHVYIALGAFEDGSLLLLHASPPCVSLCGTMTPDEREGSIAISVATEYMERYFGEAQSRYPKRMVSIDYLKQYDQYRWDDAVLADPDGYRTMPIRELLDDLLKK